MTSTMPFWTPLQPPGDLYIIFLIFLISEPSFQNNYIISTFHFFSPINCDWGVGTAFTILTMFEWEANGPIESSTSRILSCFITLQRSNQPFYSRYVPHTPGTLVPVSLASHTEWWELKHHSGIKLNQNAFFFCI